MIRNGLSLMVFVLACGLSSSAQAQGYVYVAPSYWPTAPVPVTVYRPIVPVVVPQTVYVPQPVYVPRPVYVPQLVYVPQPVVVHQPVVQSAYYAPSVPVVAPVVPRSYRESYYNGPVVSRYNFDTYGPGPDYSYSVRATPRTITIRERAH
jgi:hypothetical protein